MSEMRPDDEPADDALVDDALIDDGLEFELPLEAPEADAFEQTLLVAHDDDDDYR